MMADETATLKDTVVSDATATTEVTEATPAGKTTEVRITEAPSPEAAELGQILLSSGISKDQLNDLLESPRALASLRDQIQNNPQEFLNSLFRSDPQMGEKFLEVAGEEYVRRYDKPTKSGKPAGDSKIPDDLMREVEALREKTNRLETEQQRRDHASAVAQAKARYEARVEEMFNLKEVQDLGLTKSEQRNMRARLSTELSQDPNVVERISKGTFIDVPKAFQALLQEKVDERKALADADKQKRERSKMSAFAEFPSGANPFMVPDRNADMFSSWEGTEDGFAKALESLR